MSEVILLSPLLIFATRGCVHSFLKLWTTWPTMPCLSPGTIGIPVSFDAPHIYFWILDCYTLPKISSVKHHALCKVMMFHLQRCLIILSFLFYGCLTALSTATIPKSVHIPLNNLCRSTSLFANETPLFFRKKNAQPWSENDDWSQPGMLIAFSLPVVLGQLLAHFGQCD